MILTTNHSAMLRSVKDYVLDYSNHYRGYCKRYNNAPSIHENLFKLSFNHLQSLILGGSVNIHDKDCCGRTLLHCAVIWGRRERLSICELLLSLGSEINSRDNVNRTALHAAVFEHDPVLICKLLLEKGAYPNVQDFEEEFPIHIAVQFEQIHLVKLLINWGSDVNRIGKYNRRPLEIAVDSANLRRKEMCKMLLAAGANVNATNKEGQTVLHLTSKECSYESIQKVAKGLPISHLLYNVIRYKVKSIIDFLIEEGAEINIKDTYGRTPLHYASMNCKLSTVNELLERGADVNALDEQGKTPGHYSACDRNGSEVLKVLLGWGASIAIRDNKGETVLDVAKRCGHLLTKSASSEHIMKMRLLGLLLNETHPSDVEENKCLQEQCKIEIEKIKNIQNKELNLYDILKRSKSIAPNTILDLEPIVYNCIDIFPHYATFIDATFKKANMKHNRMTMVDRALASFVNVTRSTNLPLPPEVLYIIMSKLDNKDLKTVMQL